MNCFLQKRGREEISFDIFFDVIAQHACQMHSFHGPECEWSDESIKDLRAVYNAIHKKHGCVTKADAMFTGRTYQAQSTECQW